MFNTIISYLRILVFFQDPKEVLCFLLKAVLFYFYVLMYSMSGIGFIVYGVRERVKIIFFHVDTYLTNHHRLVIALFVYCLFRLGLLRYN